LRDYKPVSSGYRIIWLKKGETAPYDGWLIEEGLYQEVTQ